MEDPDLENAIKKGDILFLEEARKRGVENDMYLLGQNSSGDNILHIALRSGNNEFIEKITKMLPTSVTYKLIRQTNINGDTLFHVAAELGNIPIFELLLQFDYLKKFNDVRNSSGNLPYDVLISTGNLNCSGVITTTTHTKWNEDNWESVIKQLVRTDSSVACWHDERGLTPLLRAASLKRINYMKLMIECCPDSAKEVDTNSGKTILHFLINRISTYHEGKELLLQIPEIDRLKDVKDNQGRTPLDLALKSNYKMARLLLDFSTSTSDLTHIQQLRHNFEQIKKKSKRTLEEYGVIDGVSIRFIKGKLSKFGINLLFSRDSKRRNVLHNLMRLQRRTPIVLAEYLEFIFQLLDSYPKLACHTDINGDTPVHILMQNSHDTKIHPYCRKTHTSSFLNNETDNYATHTLFLKSALPHQLVHLCHKAFVRAKKVDEADVNANGNTGETKEEGCHFKYDLPSLVQNMEGNTPFHEALKAGHFFSIVIFILSTATAATAPTSGLTNKRKETPLHLLAECYLVEWPYFLIEEVFKGNKEAASSQDQDGLTPIMRAVQVGHIQTVRILDDLNQEASKIVDNNGRTLWHMLVNQPSSKTEEFVNDIGRKQHLIDLLKIQDNEGKTPLHLALESRRFTHARLFLKCSYDNWSPSEKLKWMKELLEIKDGDGITSGDQFASIPDLPQDLENILMSENPVEMIGYRSVYGISTQEMKDYVNMMGVIAALLTTITFTAAFTVPGGAVQDDKDVKDKHAVGTPLLVNTVAFQAFMFFDVLTMCLSTMVLFCLLWILATGSKLKSVILMDFSILLLLISFYTTLMSFMSGVYVTTIRVKPWIAIYTLVMCLSLMLLMQKCLIIKFLGPMGPIVTSIVRKYYRDLCCYLTEICKKVNDIACKCFRYLGSLKLCKKVKDMVIYASNESSALHSPHQEGPSE